MGVGGIADGIEGAAVGEASREAHPRSARQMPADPFDEADGLGHCRNRPFAQAELQREQEEQFGIGGAGTGIEMFVVEHGFHRSTQALEMIDLAVVHERPGAVDEGMTVVAAGRAMGCGAHMGEEKR